MAREIFSSYHFVGIMGSGMSALAQYLCWSGKAVSGSDRLAFSPEMKEAREQLERCGCHLFPQDGSGVTSATEALVISTAIEEDNPDLEAARRLGIPILHRSDLLAALCASHRTIAVCGTSGKSTVAGMIFEILRGCGKDPSLLMGANLIGLNQEGFLGNAYKGRSTLLVIEADESDGTLIKYEAIKALVLNISQDHKSISEILELFQVFARQTPWVAKNADDPGLHSIAAAHTFGISECAEFRPDSIDALTPAIHFKLQGLPFELSLPGFHNLSNALAALCVSHSEGCDWAQMAKAIRGFRGLRRRFEIFRTARGITVIDDYAHNPQKMRAAIVTARDFGRRILAIFQPHGYGPARLLREEWIRTLSDFLRRGDEVYFLPIYYAGGTVKRDISSEQLAEEAYRRGIRSHFSRTRDGLITALERKVTKGDVILVMGGRDPSLPHLAQKIKDRFGSLK
jgi:UDP-N-acetylmuramate--alanine ligase